MHLNATSAYVHAWVVTESPVTLSGHNRGILHQVVRGLGEVFGPERIRHEIVPAIRMRQTRGTLRTDGAFKNEALQRSWCELGLRSFHPHPDDMVLILDPDEVPSVEQLAQLVDSSQSARNGLLRVPLKEYTYDLSCRGAIWTLVVATSWALVQRMAVVAPDDWAHLARFNVKALRDKMGATNGSTAPPESGLREERLAVSRLGFHLTYGMTDVGIVEKLRSFAHTELSDEQMTDAASVAQRVAFGCDPGLRWVSKGVPKLACRDRPNGTTWEAASEEWMRRLAHDAMPHTLTRAHEREALQLRGHDRLRACSELSLQARPPRSP